MTLDYQTRAQEFAAKYLSGNGWELGLSQGATETLNCLLAENGFVKSRMTPELYQSRARKDKGVIQGYDLLINGDLSRSPIDSLFIGDTSKHQYSLVSVSGDYGKSRFDSDLEGLLLSVKRFNHSNNNLIEYSNMPAVVVGGLGAGLAAFLPAYHFILSKGMGADIPHLNDMLIPLGLLAAVVAGVAGGAQYAKHRRKHLNEIRATAEREFNKNWQKFNEDYLATRTVYDQRALKSALGVN
ncbi:MAG: hypothetical protein WCV90_00685 [Candidatus Woesearchaeota archaeon]|jgi:hypothetical protein